MIKKTVRQVRAEIKAQTPKTDPARLTAAYEAGKAAFANGAKCVPYYDRTFMATLTPTVGTNIEVLTGWQRGWTAANLAAEVQQ